MTATDSDLTAADISWDLETLLGDRTVDEILDDAAERAVSLERFRGEQLGMSADEFLEMMTELASIKELIEVAGNYAMLRFATDTSDPANGALLASVEERGTEVGKLAIFVELEWAALPDDRVDEILSDERLAFCAHHLANARKLRPHLRPEGEEKILADKSITGRHAWARLFTELDSAITAEIDGEVVSLEMALSMLSSPDRELRRRTGEAITAGLEPGLRTRAFIFNTILADKATDDRIRNFDSWISSRNLENEATDASVDALVEAVVSRYDIAQRWYSVKARLLGLDRLADYDRMASVADVDEEFTWTQGREIVLDSYASFSPEMANAARRFFDENWIDAPIRPGKQSGAFCAYTVPSHHPYVLLNWSSRRRDVLTLAHELGHGLHAYLARGQGVFHQSTPLTLAETASVFGETVTFGRLLAATTEPRARLALLAESLEGAIATVFRQIAMNRFEAAAHTERREVGELSVERFGELWSEAQGALFGDSVEMSPGFANWWSYVPHFIHTPGYVYAYAYGQLLALSVYSRFALEGEAFVPSYLKMLTAGGSMAPEELGALVGLDLSDPGFWLGGLSIVEDQLRAAEEAAAAIG